MNTTQEHRNLEELDTIRRVSLSRAVQVGEPNMNEQIYTQGVLEEALEKFNAKCPQFGTVAGTVDPMCEIPIKKISHKILSVRIDENGYLVSDIVILNTPAGQNLNTLFENGVKLNAGIVGAGSLDIDSMVYDLTITSIEVLPELTQEQTDE